MGAATAARDPYQTGLCGTYAVGLMRLRPGLRMGVAGDEKDEDGYIEPDHYFAHDDTHAYDSTGKHPLPYSGRWKHSELDHKDPWVLDAEHDTHEETEAAIAKAQQHAIKHRVLEGGKTAATRQPIDMGKYFAPGVSDYDETPWRRRGLHIGMDERTWASMPVEDVPTHGLRPTQKRVFKKYLHGQGDDRAKPGRQHPWVVEHDGDRWLLDGHHRVVDAIDNGQDTIKAHVMRPGFGHHEAAVMDAPGVADWMDLQPGLPAPGC